MKYNEILKFEPITDVIQFDLLDGVDYQKEVIRTFVYPDYFVDTIIPEIVNQLIPGGRNQKGVQVIGNYGTGKSHLMSLISLVAQNRDYLDLVTNATTKQTLAPIAGKFKVLRFELGSDKSLWSIVTFQLQEFLNSIGVDFTFDPDSRKMYREQMEDMLAAFEEKFPEQGIMLVIDEMLSYLQARTSVGYLAQDLPVLQALGQLCADSRFGFMFGVQEEVYKAKEFKFETEMLLKVKDRYVDVTIRKEEVAFVVQNRLLRKTPAQKAEIRRHLEPFIGLFSDIHSHLDDYVDLFPVHPSYFDNFQKIRVGRSQREILKTLSKQFAQIADKDIPTDNPGLITYDQYWDHMRQITTLMAVPEFKTVADTVAQVHDKIQSNFTGLRSRQIPLAKRIANATAIKILQADLSKHHGARAEVLADDLCYTANGIDERDLLIDTVAACANLIVKATSGQYFEQDSNNGEYHLRTEGGVNFDQQIAQYAETLSAAKLDESFFRFLVEAFNMTDSDPYRSGFHIYTHQLEWRSHKVTRDGYIFMGHPNEKSTTQPKQSFYMVFMPLFQEDKKKRNTDSDEIYFVMDDLSDEFKNLVAKLGAAFILMTSADSAQKPHYRNAYEALLKRTIQAFDACYLDATKVYYSTNEPRILKTFQIPGSDAGRLDKFDSVASEIFDPQFVEESPNYPVFTNASQLITKNNRDRYIAAAKAKLIRPSESNRDGEAILAALGCYAMGEITTTDSMYAQSVLNRLIDKGPNKVLNRDEIIVAIPNSDQKLWRSIDFNIEADLEFLVLCALIVTGECEISLNNSEVLNASNLDKLRNLSPDEYYSFASIKRPKGINLPAVKALTMAFTTDHRDLSGQLNKSDTYGAIVNAGRRLAADTQRFINNNLLRGAIVISGVELINDADVIHLRNNLKALSGFFDKLTTFTSEAKLKNMPFDVEAINTMKGYYQAMLALESKIKKATELDSKVSYLNQARMYVPVGSALERAITSAVGRLHSILSADSSDADIDQYSRELEEVKAKYIEWYLDEYHRYCLKDIDNADKTELLNSGTYRSLEPLSQLPMLNGATYNHLRSDLMRLKIADPQAPNLLQSSPYAGFDPRNNPQQPSVHELRQEVNDLHNRWVEEIKQFVQADEQQRNLALMDVQARDYAARIVSGLEPIDDFRSASAVAEFVKQLCKSLVQVAVSSSDIASVFSRPMTPGDAISAFERFILSKTRGHNQNDVRIVFSNDNSNS